MAIRKCSKETALTFLARLYTKVQEGNVVTLTAVWAWTGKSVLTTWGVL